MADSEEFRLKRLKHEEHMSRVFDEVMGLGEFADSSRGSATSSKSGGQDEAKEVDETSGLGEQQPIEEEDSNSSRQEEKMDEGVEDSSFPRIASSSSEKHSSFNMGTNEGGGGGSGGAAFDDALDGLPSFGQEEEEEDWHFALPLGTLEDVDVSKANRKMSQPEQENSVVQGDSLAREPREEEEEEQEGEGSQASANTSHSSQDPTPENSRDEGVLNQTEETEDSQQGETSEAAPMEDSNPPTSPSVNIKDEPIDEGYDAALLPQSSIRQIKEELEHQEEELRISSVYSVGGGNTFAAPTIPTAISAPTPTAIFIPGRGAVLQAMAPLPLRPPAPIQTSLPALAPIPPRPPQPPVPGSVRCSGCSKVLLKGQTAFQRKGSTQLFCSTVCLTGHLPPANKNRSCFQCNREILQPRDMITIPADDSTLMHFCGQFCLSVFRHKKKQVDKAPDNRTDKRVERKPEKAPEKPVERQAEKPFCSVCRITNKIEHEVTHQGRLHRLCSDACFVTWRKMRQLAMNCCEGCGLYCNSNSGSCQTLTIDRSQLNFCGPTCIGTYKQNCRKTVECANCHIIAIVSTTLMERDQKGKVQLYCSPACVEQSRPPQHILTVVLEDYNTLQDKVKKEESTGECSGGHSKSEHLQERTSLQKTLELLDLFDGDKSDLENLSDNDDGILDPDYQPLPREQSSSEDGSSGDEDPIPRPTEHRRGRKRLRSENNGTCSDYDIARSHAPRRRRHSQQIEADDSDDGLEEPKPGPSRQGPSNKGRGMRWRFAPLRPNLARFEHKDETKQDRKGWTPLNYFEQYIDKDLMKIISDCSNAMSLTRSEDALNTSVDEVYHFFGACILMSCVQYPKLRMHWSKAWSFTAITDRFTRDRFFKLRQSLKVLIDDDVPKELKTRDKFWKVRPFLDRILRGCRSQARPECVSIGEQMIPFTGTGPCRPYQQMKPNPVGIKNFVCATADGIVLDFDLYQGTDALLEQVEEPEGLGLGSLVMARLCQTLHRGTKVYCDRFFTSIQGAKQMMKKELYVTGAVMKNRVAAAMQKLPTDKTIKKAGRGTSAEVSTGDGKLCVVKWYDNKQVLMMSAVHGAQPEDICQHWDKKQKQYVSFSRPSIVREYNLKMGGVDLVGRMISYYCMSARTKKWTMRMLMHFTDLALANSWLLYCKDLKIGGAPKKSIMQFLEFRMEVARTLLTQHHSQEDNADFSELSQGEDDSKQGKKRPVMAVPHVSVRRRANAHLPEMISMKNAARCRAEGCTGRTRVRCGTCKMFLCLQADRNCYAAFHT